MNPEWRYSMFLLNVVILTICILSLLMNNAKRSLQIQSQNTKKILLWNPHVNDKRWGLPEDVLGPEDLRDSLGCPVTDCIISNDKHFMQPLELYDAIVFHPSKEAQVPSLRPPKRCNNQLYVLGLRTPPPYTTPIKSEHSKHYYNLTMTYRLDSDVVWPFYRFIDIETNTRVSPAKRPSWRQPPVVWNETETWLLDLWTHKTRDVVWYVTQCYTSSQREMIFESLQRYVDVELYGKCGSQNETETDVSQPPYEKYKFYLSFESALCKDFVTEEFFQALENGLIPVVFGGADYSSFAPPHSYINVEDYASMEELAKYLRELSTNPEKYFRYFWWRHYYRLSSFSPFCDLCEELHNRQEKVQTYKDIQRWWFDGNCRFETKIKI